MLKRQTRKLTITPPPTREEREQLAAGAASMPVEQTRITVAAMNTLQYGRYEANRRAVGPWLEAQTGKGWREAAQDDAGLLLLEAGLRWARIAAAVTAVETRTADRVTDEAGDWQRAEWPALDDIGAFVEDVPADLAGALDELVFDLNPGIFRTAEQDADDAKKNGGISAS